jgi:hypothetical protein
MSDAIRPIHYGGESNPHEAIKVIEHYDLGFCLGNTVKYILRAGKKDDLLEDLKKAAWYLNREVEKIEKQRDLKYGPGPADAIALNEKLNAERLLSHEDLDPSVTIGPAYIKDEPE